MSSAARHNILGISKDASLMQNIMHYTIIHTPPSAKKCWKSFLAIFKAASLSVPGRPWMSLGCKVNNAYYNSYPPPQAKSVGNHFLDISKAFLRLRPWVSLGVPRLQRIMQNIMRYTIIRTPSSQKVLEIIF